MKDHDLFQLLVEYDGVLVRSSGEDLVVIVDVNVHGQNTGH